MKKCPHCSSELKEYVGFDSYAGHPENLWDCLNAGCSPKGAETYEAKRGPGGWVRHRRALWDLWIRETDYPEVSSYQKEIDESIGTSVAIRGCTVYNVLVLDDRLAIRPGHPEDSSYGVHYIWRSKPIQSAPTQTPSKSPATGASSQTPHTQLSPLAARHIVADAQRQLTQDLCDDVLGAYTPPQQGSGQPQTSDKPTQQVTLDAELVDLYPDLYRFPEE